MVLVVANFVPNANLHHPHAIHLSFWSPFFCFRFFFQCQRFWFSKQNFGCFVLTQITRFHAGTWKLKPLKTTKTLIWFVFCFIYFQKLVHIFIFLDRLGKRIKDSPWSPSGKKWAGPTTFGNWHHLGPHIFQHRL